MANILSILIIEDDDLTAHLYQKVLEDAGFNVLTALNTDAAEQMLEGIEINLVILDHHLPDKDGTQWLEELHSREEYRELPVILVSAIARETGPLRYDPYVWFMEKPRAPQQIVTAVQSTIERFGS